MLDDESLTKIIGEIKIIKIIIVRVKKIKAKETLIIVKETKY
jgi:hypothetical protein